MGKNQVEPKTKTSPDDGYVKNRINDLKDGEGKKNDNKNTRKKII